MQRNLWFWAIITQFFIFSPLAAQNQVATPSVQVYKTDQAIKLDGVLDETVWQKALPATDFWQYFPVDTIRSPLKTEVYFAFDADNLYVAIKCFAIGDNYITGSLKRDYRASDGDSFTLLFDTFGDRTNAFVFGLNPFGVQREALISNGGRRREDFLDSWDNKWYAEAQIYPEYWIGEIAIPFKTLRYQEGSKKWLFNCYRFDTQSNERSLWVQVPRNQIVMDRAYNGEMIFEEALKKPGPNISLIPYVLGGLSQDFVDADGKTEPSYNLGGDAKISLGPSMNLDLTFNPDFSQVEVDRQVTNLDRFEIFFPERRQFFLENSDLFANMGTDRIRPFFSRRIGIARDTATGINLQNPIYYGARLSGKLNQNWRLGFLNMQTAPDERAAQPSLNFTVATLQRQVFKRSFISLFWVNKQALEDSLGTFSLKPESFNRVLGGDFNLASNNNTWQGRFFFHKSFSDDQGPQSFAQGANIGYNVRRFRIRMDQQWVGSDYNAEVGFVPRTGFMRIRPDFQLYFYPNSRLLNTHGPGLEFTAVLDDEFRKTDHQFTLNYEFRMTNTSRFQIELNQTYTYLFDDFDPSRSGLQPRLAGSEFHYANVEIDYSTDRRKKFNAFINLNAGDYFDGNRMGVRGRILYRFQPYGSISLNGNYNRINLLDLESRQDTTIHLLLLGPRLDITFSRKLFFTLLTQYNSQLNNINLNARLQWRFQPVSDLFLVYVDNYSKQTQGYLPNQRALVLKINYWFNV